MTHPAVIETPPLIGTDTQTNRIQIWPSVITLSHSVGGPAVGGTGVGGAGVGGPTGFRKQHSLFESKSKQYSGKTIGIPFQFPETRQDGRVGGTNDTAQMASGQFPPIAGISTLIQHG